MSFAQITLIGHIGRDPELTSTPEGVAVTRFSLAVSKKEGKEGKERTTWFNCTAFRGPAETIHQYVAKGSPLFVQGDLSVREYTGKGQEPNPLKGMGLFRQAHLSRLS